MHLGLKGIGMMGLGAHYSGRVQCIVAEKGALPPAGILTRVGNSQTRRRGRLRSPVQDSRQTTKVLNYSEGDNIATGEVFVIVVR